MIIYVTGRPDMQKHRVVAWLTQHNFPHGIVSFCDGLTHDPLRQKAAFLQGLQQEVCNHLHSCTARRGIQWRFYSGVTEGACGKSWRSTTGEREVRKQWHWGDIATLRGTAFPGFDITFCGRGLMALLIWVAYGRETLLTLLPGCVTLEMDWSIIDLKRVKYNVCNSALISPGFEWIISVHIHFNLRICYFLYFNYYCTCIFAWIGEA